jgi:hypothetical protein
MEGSFGMGFSARSILSVAALVAFAAGAADVTGEWAATFVTAAGQQNYTYVFRQSGGELIGTIRSQDGVVAIADGAINNKTVWFTENVTVEGRRVVVEYTGELVSDTEIRFKRQAVGPASPTVQFVATRTGTP